MTDIYPNKLRAILITGVAGLLGRVIAHHFSRRGILVYGVDHSSAENAPMAELEAYCALTLPEPQFESLLAEWRPQAIIHCAGRASVPQSMQNPMEDYRQGPALTFFVLDVIRRIIPESAFLLLSSAAVYGNSSHLPISEDTSIRPLSAYGYHKLQSEMICAEFANVFGLRTASARVFSAYGPGLRRQAMWDIVYNALTQSEVRLQGTGQESRDFIHVRDVASGLDTILTKAPLSGEAHNLASGVETRIADLAKLILHEIENPPPLTFSGELPPGTPKNWQADIQQISKLGFQPQVTLADGVSNFVAWCRNEVQGV